MSQGQTVDRIVSFGVGAAVVGAVLQGVSHLANIFIFDAEAWNLDAEAEDNAWAWASSVATFAAAFVVLLLALLARSDAGRLWFLGIVLAFFSLDDLIAVHEQIGTAVRDEVFGLPTGWGRVAWPVIFFPLLAAVFLLLWRLSREGPPRAGRLLRIGLAMLVGSVALELVSAPWYISGRTSRSVPGALEVVAEEGLELAGWVLITTALTAVLVAGRLRD